MKELSISIQEGNLTECNLLIMTMGKALAQMKNNPVFRRQVLLPPPTTRQGSVETVLKRMAEVNCSQQCLSIHVETGCPV